MTRRDLRASLIGEAGLRLALALAGITALTAFVTAAGPRELAAEQAIGVRQATAALPPGDQAIYTSGSWYPIAGNPRTYPTFAQQASFAAAVIRNLPRPISPERTASRIWIAGQPFPLIQPFKGRANTGVFSFARPPRVQISYDSKLAADSTVVAGHLPDRITTGVPGAPRALVVQVAITQAMATRFEEHVGSIVEFASAAGGRLLVTDQQPVYLQVTGIVAPRPGEFWNSTQVVATPTPPSKYQAYWLGGAVIGQSELPELQTTLWSGQTVQGVWYTPLSLTAVTPANIGLLANVISAQSIGSYGVLAEDAAGFRFTETPVITSQLPADLGTIQSQLTTTNSLDSFVIAGIFAAALLLILLCAGLAADRYQAEFALIRARGGSVGQVARQALARAAGSAGPGFVVGLALAILIIPQGNGIATAWLLPAAALVFVFVCIPLRCAWRVRRDIRPPDARRAEIAAPKRSARRTLAELTVVLAGVAAVAALQTRGLAAGSNELALAIPLLVAATASIAIARLYAFPVRVLLPLATRRRGPVGFLGLARAGRSGLSTILPALALVLTLTLAAFGWMAAQTVYAGQVTTSWLQSGADAVVAAAGNNTISASAQQAFAKVPGVRHIALVYSTPATSLTAATIYPTSNDGGPVANSFNTGLLVADPAQYAALAGGTPWPAFPATVLSRRSGPVPILFSAGAAPHDDGRAVIGSRQTMDIGGISIPVVLAGTISATPAFPNGGNYIVLPQWAVGQFPSIPGMTTMLATGPGLSAAVMTAAAKTDVPGGTVVIRSQVLHRLRTAASEYAVRLFILSIWIAVGLSLVAMIFGLAATGQSRRHLRTRMAALGMSARQSRALAFTDTIPLLSVAILGMAGAGAALVLISGQVINLGPLTGSAGEVPVTLDWPALAVPAAAAVVLALAGIGFENWRANRAEAATALRTEEAG